jgi:hypothetical protein
MSNQVKVNVGKPLNGRDKQLSNFLTVGQLKALLQNYPDDAPVYMERIEDKFFTVANSEYEANSVLKPCPSYPEYNDQFVQVFGIYDYDDGDDSVYLIPSYITTPAEKKQFKNKQAFEYPLEDGLGKD